MPVYPCRTTRPLIVLVRASRTDGESKERREGEDSPASSVSGKQPQLGLGFAHTLSRVTMQKSSSNY